MTGQRLCRDGNAPHAQRLSRTVSSRSWAQRSCLGWAVPVAERTRSRAVGYDDGEDVSTKGRLEVGRRGKGKARGGGSQHQQQHQQDLVAATRQAGGLSSRMEDGGQRVWWWMARSPASWPCQLPCFTLGPHLAGPCNSRRAANQHNAVRFARATLWAVHADLHRRRIMCPVAPGTPCQPDARQCRRPERCRAAKLSAPLLPDNDTNALPDETPCPTSSHSAPRSHPSPTWSGRCDPNTFARRGLSGRCLLRSRLPGRLSASVSDHAPHQC